MQVGDHVVYVDPLSIPRQAILTAVWDNGDAEKYPNPAVNLVFVSGDAAKHDTYGRQIERQTSCGHVSNEFYTACPGNYWCRPEEYDPERDRKIRSEQSPQV